MSQREQPFAALNRGLFRIPSAVLLVVEVLVLLAMLAAAWRQRSVMPLVPSADPDAWGYLYPALSWLGGFGLQQTSGRDWLYPAMLALFLKTSGSFAGIVLWQKSLAMISGILMAVTWRCWVSTLPFRRWILFLVSLGGLLPILSQLTNPQNIYFETSIRPEAVLSFFVYAQLACLMGYYKYRWQTPKALPSTILGAAAIVLSYACLWLKPSWLLAFVVTAAPVFAGVFGRVPSLKTRLLTPALGIVFSLLVLWLPSAVFLIKDSASVTMLPDALFAVHARLIDAMLNARIATLSDSDPEKAKLRALVTVLENELPAAEVDRPYEKLGFNADYLMHSPPLTEALYRYTGNDDRKFRAFCISCYRDAALYDPSAFARKISVQFTHFLFPTPDTFYKDFHDFAEYYQDSATNLDPDLPDRFPANIREMYHRYRADLAVRAGISLKLNRKSKFRTFRHVFAPWVLPLEILFVLTFAASLIWRPLRDMRFGGWAAVSLFSAPLGNALTVCIVHALDINRYRHTYGGFLLFALVAMALFSALAIARAVRHALGMPSKRPESS